MSETMKMIDVINKNKKEKQLLMHKKIKKEKKNKILSNIFFTISMMIFMTGIFYFTIVLNFALNG